MTCKSPDASGVVQSHSRHQCLIYAGAPSRQLSALAALIKQKLDEGNRCLYLNSRPMVAGIRSFLAATGIDVESEVVKARLILSSDSLVSADGDFDVGQMLRKLEEAVDQALRDGYTGLWATGDMTWEFGSEKNYPKLLDYEYRLEEFMQRQPKLSGICQYHQDTLPQEVVRQARQTHQMLFINETLSRVNPDFIPTGRFDPKPVINRELAES